MVDKRVTGPFATARHPEHCRALWVVSLSLVDVLPRMLKGLYHSHPGFDASDFDRLIHVRFRRALPARTKIDSLMFG